MVVRDWAWPKFKLEWRHYYVWALIDNALLIDLKKCADSREEREIVEQYNLRYYMEIPNLWVIPSVHLYMTCECVKIFEDLLCQHLYKHREDKQIFCNAPGST